MKKNRNIHIIIYRRNVKGISNFIGAIMIYLFPRNNMMYTNTATIDRQIIKDQHQAFRLQQLTIRCLTLKKAPGNKKPYKHKKYPHTTIY